MQQLDRNTLKELTELLLPYCRTPDERKALFTLALGFGHPLLSRLNYADNAQVFVLNAITQLNAYGEIEPGTTALWALLQELRRRVGADKQDQIDRLQAEVITDDIPSSAFSTQSKTRSAISESSSSRPTIRELLKQINAAEASEAWSEVIEMGELLLKGNPYHSIAVPKTANAYYQRGKQHSYHHEMDYALADLSRALVLNPLMEDGYFERGNVYAAIGDYTSALADFDRAIQLAPSNVDYLLARSSVYHMKGDSSLGEKDAKRADTLSAKLSKKS